MTLKRIRNIYESSKPIAYDTQVVDDMLTELNSIVNNQGNRREETMLLSMICSALKSYCNTSVDAYIDVITKIVIRLENTYTVNGLLSVIIDA